jgi:uncharacterized protein (DUF1330 family)
MTVYAVVELQITNLAAMTPYMLAVSETIAAHGGKYLVRPTPDQVAGNAEVAEGGPDDYPVKVIIEFPNMAAGRGWYNSAQYQAIVRHRTDNSTGKFVWVEGVE